MPTLTTRFLARRLGARLWLLLAFAGGGLLAAPLSTAHAELRNYNLWWTPKAVTTGGHEIDFLLMTIFWLTLAVFIITQAVYIFFLVKYRYRKGVKAVYSHGNNKLELIWTATPAAIFIVLALWSDREWLLLRGPWPDNALTIDIVAYQFGFHIRNPGLDDHLAAGSQDRIEKGTNDFGLDLAHEDPAGLDDFQSENQLTLPVGRPAHMLLRSEDVIHAFYVPEFRMYQDILPGRQIDWVWFTPEQVGHYALACNQLCGSGHYNMHANIDVVSAEDYAKLVAEKSKNALESHKQKQPAPAASPAPSPVAETTLTSPAPVVTAANH